MRRVLSLILFLIFILLIISCNIDNIAKSKVPNSNCEKANNLKLELTLNLDESSSTGVYIPKDLEECFIELDKMLHPEAKKYLSMEKENILLEKDDELHDFFGHMQLGLFLRNSWGLWSENRLVKYFNRIGIFHPDDMSGVIITSYMKYLQNKSINLADQVKYYQKYWEVTKFPKPFVDPKTGSEIKARSGRFFQERYIYIGYSNDRNDIWVYEYDKGWYRPDKKLLKMLGYSQE